jgi:hypothetical protein
MAKDKGLFIDPDLHRRWKESCASQEISMKERLEELMKKELEKDGDSNRQEPNRRPRRP